ncbi:MAG: hypothetical protein IKT92_05720 [Bacteroidaceae bacterium]|nr:hypothetical protein [Bacteroidaceae bacterium]
MKNHFSKMGMALLNAALLSTVGFTSCADDKFHLKDYEESTPEFLGQSIYHELQNRGEFSTVLRLIDDLEYAEVLSKTGSKTLFVANDSAYGEFFKNNPWGVTSYEGLSKNQKRVLLNNSMLNNAYVLEMLANTEGGGKNLCLRQGTSATASDSVTRWSVDDLPKTLSLTETDWFSQLRSKGDSVYMALDATDPMMTHFLEGQMKNKNVTFGDVEKIMNDVPWIPEGTTSFGFINDCRIIDGDIVCLNGYLHLLDKVLLAPGNMAEVIRSNGNTNYFSAMLDRFAAPYYNEQLTRQYKALNDISADSIFEKRYISNRSQGGGKITKRPDGLSFGEQQFLPFDPGWNQYAVSSSTVKEQDMAAMFVPSDEAMLNYFVYGGGTDLIQRYGIAENTEENLLVNLYQIPLHLIQPLIQNLMKDSFNESVPSKYLTIVNDAQDQMFASYTSEEAYKAHIDKCLLANNGVIYITNTVDAPADYASVIAPALISSNTQIVRSVVRADDNYIEGTSYNNAPLKQYFSTYLKAMQSNFSFFVPIDEGLEAYGYVEPASFATQPFGAKSTNRYYWSFKYDDKTRGAVIPVEATAYNYNLAKGQQPGTDKKKGNSYVSKVTDNMSAGVGQQKRMNLIEMIDQHILVHDNPAGVNDGRTYYLSRNGAPVRLTEKGTFEGKNIGMKVEGGYQVMINDPAEGYAENDHKAEVLEGYDKTSTSNGYGNGMTYLIDRPIQPTMRSVYNHFKANAELSPFYEFYELANPDYVSDDLLRACGYYKQEVLDAKTGLPTGEFKDMSSADQQAEKLKFHVFARQNDNVQGTTTYCPANNEQLVRFFNNYNYTIYVPTNEQVTAARAKGLMTWNEIEEWVKGRTNDYENELSEADLAKARTMITVLVNFVKYHFQDQSVFVDNITGTQQYQTSCIDNVTNSYLSLDVNQSPSTLSVLDRSGKTVDVVASEEMRNILARDICYNARAASASYIKNSSYVVIHQIDGYLNFNSPEDYKGIYFEGDPTKNEMPVGNFDFWNYATPEELNAYTAKYRLR